MLRSACVGLLLATLAHGRLELHENPMAAWYTPTSAGSRGVPPTSVKVSSTGDIFVCGYDGYYSYSDASTKAYISKYGPDLKHIWTRHYDGANIDYLSNIALDEDDNIYAVGFTSSHIVKSPSTYDLLLVSLDSDGNQRWARQHSGDALYRPWYESGRNHAFSIVYTEGSVITSYRGNGEFLNIVKFNATQGDPIWNQRLTPASNRVEHYFEFASGLDVDSNGNIYIAADFLGNFGPTDGSWAVPDAGLTNAQTNTWEIVVVKLSPEGEPQWRKFISELSHQLTGALVVGPDDNVYVCGRTDTSLYGEILGAGRDAFLIKYSPEGTRLGTRLWDIAGDNNICTGLAIDNHGSIYAASYEEGVSWQYQDRASISRFDTELNRLQDEIYPAVTNGITYLSTAGVDVRDGVVYTVGAWDDRFDFFVSPWTASTLRHGYIRRYRDSRNCNCTRYDELIATAASLLNIQITP